MISLDNHVSVHEAIVGEMKQVLQWWTKQPLRHTATYGVRVYPRDAMLINHVDREDTNLVSTVLQVDQQVDAPVFCADGFGICADDSGCTDIAQISKKFYSLGEMRVLDAFKENHYARNPGASIGIGVSAIKLSMPTIFPKPNTDKRFPKSIEEKKAKLAADQNGKKTGKKRKALQQGQNRHAPSMREKEEQLEQELVEHSAGKG